MTPDFSPPKHAEHLNALLGQAGVDSLRALTDMPLAETCNTPGLLSYDAKDWDLIARAAEQSGLIDRLAFDWRDEEPGVGLKEVAPSKRALLCLVGLGIISLAQLYDLRLGTLLSLRRHIDADDIACLLLRLKEYQVSGHTSGLPNNHDADSPPVSQSVSQPDSQIHLDDATARLSIAVLNLSSRTREYLHYSDVHTLRDLVDRIPSDAVKLHSQGVRQLWKEVKSSLQNYLDSNSPRSTQAKESPPEPNLARVKKVTPPDHTKIILEVATSPELPPDDARPIDVLNLPDYAHDQLARAGIHTIGDLIATLPNGPWTIGRRTWIRIRSALSTCLARQPESTPPVAHAEAGRGVPPCVDPESSLHIEWPIDMLDLPDYARDQLGRAGIHTIGDLITTLPNGPRTIGPRTWKRIRCALSNRLAMQPDDAPAPEPTHPTGNVPSRADAESSPRTERSTNLLRTSDSASGQSKQTGVNADRELVSSLPTIPHASDSNTGKPATQALETSPSNQSELAAEASQTETDLDRPLFIATQMQDMLSAPTITDRPISVLNLPDPIVNQLSWLGFCTIGKLITALPNGPRGITLQTWRHIQSAIETYTERSSDISQASTQAAVMRDATPLVEPESPVDEVIAYAPEPEDLSVGKQVPGPQATKHELGALPAALEDRSITELSLSTDALECLQRAGFETIGELWAILAQGYSRLAIPDMSWLLWKEIWLVTTRHATSGIADSTPLDTRFAAWFAQLNESQRQVLEWRYGLTEGQDLTLEETGDRLNLTRERVRQIERKALELLRHPSGQGPVHALIAELYADVVAGGGVMSETQLGIALAGIADIGDANPQGAVRLLLETSEKLKLVKIEGVQAWCLPLLCDLVPLVGLQVIDILRKASAPLSLDELVRRCKQIQGRHDEPNQLYDKFILACVRVNEKLVERHEGSIGLATWERHWQDDIILALRRRGEPAHYTAIADAINASLQNGQHVTARVVHTCLMRYPDIFLCVGVRGTYGLREWNEDQGNSAYMDVLTQVLQEAGHSLENSQDSARSGRPASPSRRNPR